MVTRLSSNSFVPDKLSPKWKGNQGKIWSLYYYLCFLNFDVSICLIYNMSFFGFLKKLFFTNNWLEFNSLMPFCCRKMCKYVSSSILSFYGYFKIGRDFIHYYVETNKDICLPLTHWTLLWLWVQHFKRTMTDMPPLPPVLCWHTLRRS